MNTPGIHHQPYIDAIYGEAHLARHQLYGDPGLAPGSTPANFKTTNAFSYSVGGVVYNKAAQQNIAPPGVSTGANEYRKVMVHINAAGTIATTPGAVASTQAAAQLPDVPVEVTPIGHLELPPSFVSATTAITTEMCKPWVHDIKIKPTPNA